MFRRTRILLAICLLSMACARGQPALESGWTKPPAAAKPWVFWYWMQGAVSKAGIHADLVAMRSAGIGGAYLMPISGPAHPPLYEPVAEQLSPLWWEMVRYSMQQADSLGLQLAMHDCDGFAVAGGPWITPELSMQKVVWTKTLVKDGRAFDDTLARPENYKGYYKDIKILAYPSPEGSGVSTRTIVPKVTTSTGEDVQFLAVAGNKKSFKSSKPCWIQLAFDKPFTCRSLIIHTDASNYESERLLIETSDDGVHFKPLTHLIPPRHGWQDGDAP